MNCTVLFEEVLGKRKRTDSSFWDKKKAAIKNYKTVIEGILVVLDEKSHSKTTSSHKNIFNTVIFVDSLPKRYANAKIYSLNKKTSSKNA